MAHGQVESAWTPIVPDPPVAGKLAWDTEAVMLHGGGSGVPSWVIRKSWPAIRAVEDRRPPVLATTVKLTLPLPVPPDDPSVTHGSPSDAVHWQVLAVVMLTLNVLPEIGIL
jgi:hypothetical protein